MKKTQNHQLPPFFESEYADDLLTKYGLTLVSDMSLKRYEIINESEELIGWVPFDQLSDLDEDERQEIIEALCERAVEQIQRH